MSNCDCLAWVIDPHDYWDVVALLWRLAEHGYNITIKFVDPRLEVLDSLMQRLLPPCLYMAVYSIAFRRLARRYVWITACKR